MQQQILQQQQAQQRMILAQQAPKPVQPLLQSSQIPTQVESGNVMLAGQAQQPNGIQMGNNGQGHTLVTPQMLASMGINMAQMATLTPNGIQPIPGGLVNLNQFPALALAPSSQQNTTPQQPGLLSSLSQQQQQHTLPVQQVQQQQQQTAQINANQPMQLVVPSMALIEQLQQQRMLQQQQAVANTQTVSGVSGVLPTVPTSMTAPQLPILQQPSHQQPQQIMGGVLLPKTQVSLPQIDQTQLAQMLMNNQAQVQAQGQMNPSLASMQAQLQSQPNNANSQKTIQISQYMNQLQSLAMLGQQGGHPIMK